MPKTFDFTVQLATDTELGKLVENYLVAKDELYKYLRDDEISININEEKK